MPWPSLRASDKDLRSIRLNFTPDFSSFVRNQGRKTSGLRIRVVSNVYVSFISFRGEMSDLQEVPIFAPSGKFSRGRKRNCKAHVSDHGLKFPFKQSSSTYLWHIVLPPNILFCLVIVEVFNSNLFDTRLRVGNTPAPQLSECIKLHFRFTS